MRKFLFKTLLLLLATGGLFFWLRSNASVLAGAAALGLDDDSNWLASHSNDPEVLDLLESSNTGFVRVLLPFNEVSPAPGAFSWAHQGESGYVDYDQLFIRLNRRGIRPVVVLSGGPVFANHLYPQQPVFREELLDAWSNYLRAAVQQFGGQVDYWQVGDEINNPESWGRVVFPGADAPIAAPDPELYADMLSIAYSVVKSAQSSDTVLLGGLVLDGDCAFHPVNYMQALSDADAWYAFDAVSLEIPPLDDTPETAVVDVCRFFPIQTTGMPLADAVRAVEDFVNEIGSRPVWAHGLAFDNGILSVKAVERGTLSEVVESDYLARATAILMAEGGADRVFWQYDPLSGNPGGIALQSFANLSQTLGGSSESDSTAQLDSGLKALRFRGSGRQTVIAWRQSTGSDYTATVVPGFEGFNPYAWSADAPSVKNRDGIELPVDNGGGVALMLGERPVIISGKPSDFKGSITLYLNDSADRAAQGLKSKVAGIFQAQKAKAAERVSAWVEEQQQSLMETLKNSFNQWLRKSLGLAKL